MKITTIPQAFRYHCDRCAETHLQENGSVAYVDAVPPGWSRLRYWEHDTGGGLLRTFDHLLCSTCAAGIYQSIKPKELE